MDVLVCVHLEQRYLDQIRQVSGDITVSTASDEEEVRAHLADVEVLAADSSTVVAIAERAPKLRWLQWWLAGVDPLLDLPIMQNNVPVTIVEGIEAPIAQFVLAQMISLSRGIYGMITDQSQHNWNQEFLTKPPSELGGKLLGLVGYGRVGHELARIARCFDMQVMAVRRGQVSSQRDGHVLVLPAGDLRQLMSKSDYVVICVPLTLKTVGMIGEHELRLMKPSGYLINIARGRIIVEEALIKALRAGWIAGAALDVFAEEPLATGSALWDLPNTIITPHAAGYTESHNQRATEQFCQNLRRYLAREPLQNLVGKQRGY